MSRARCVRTRLDAESDGARRGPLEHYPPPPCRGPWPRAGRVLPRYLSAGGTFSRRDRLDPKCRGRISRGGLEGEPAAVEAMIDWSHRGPEVLMDSGGCCRGTSARGNPVPGHLEGEPVAAFDDSSDQTGTPSERRSRPGGHLESMIIRGFGQASHQLHEGRRRCTRPVS